MEALVLSGGFFRGAAHIGALKVLEKQEFKPDIVIGTSMGSIVGGLYTHGYSPQEIEDIFLDTKWQLLIDPDIRGILSGFIPFYNPRVDGVLQGNKIKNKLKQFLKSRQEQIPFYAMVTDVVTGESISLRSGDVAKNIRASISLPAVFQAEIIKGRCYIDGGVNNNFALNVAINKGADKIVAVNAVDSVFDWDGYPQNIFDSIERFITIQSVEISERQKAYAENKLGKDFILIEPDLKPGSGINPKLIKSHIEQGYKEARKVLGR